MSELTNAEIQAKIAIAKGWTQKKTVPFSMSIGDKLIGTATATVWKLGNDFIDPPPWDYDIAAAWELVEEMRGSGQLVIIKLWPEESVIGKYITVEVIWKRNEDGYVQVKDTAPRAICLAWLKWRGIE